MKVEVPRSGSVLFIGDSITDSRRIRDCPRDMGNGYARMAADWFHAEHPDHGTAFVNRGISGDRVRDLRQRWRVDCLQVSPQVVSVLIGVNDTWRRYSENDETPAPDFERDYRHILEMTRRELNAGLVLVEPFLIPLSDEQHEWRTDLDAKVAVVRRLAVEFGATLVAVDQLYNTECVPKHVWSDDGVHLTDAGHAVLAREWLRVVAPGT